MNTGGKPFSLSTDMRPNTLYSPLKRSIPTDAFTDPTKIKTQQLATAVNRKIPTGEPKFDGFNPGTLSNPAAVKAIQQQNIQQALSGRHGHAQVPVQNPFEAIRKRTTVGDQAVEQSFSPDQMWRGFSSQPGLLQSGKGTGAFANRLAERDPTWFSGYPSTAAYYAPEAGAGVTGYLGRFPVERMSRLGAHSPGFHPENGVDTRFIGDVMHGGPANPMLRLPTLPNMQKQQMMPSPGADLPNYEATFTNPVGGFAPHADQLYKRLPSGGNFMQVKGPVAPIQPVPANKGVSLDSRFNPTTPAPVPAFPKLPAPKSPHIDAPTPAPTTAPTPKQPDGMKLSCDLADLIVRITEMLNR